VGRAPYRAFCFTMATIRVAMVHGETEMAKKIRPWTKDDVRTLKALVREKTKTTVIARKLKRSVGATYQKARGLGVTLGGGRKKRA
jgi:hypothetical protein